MNDADFTQDQSMVEKLKIVISHTENQQRLHSNILTKE